ncbi:MAG TPA: hypothetical protein VFA32_17605 [Dehalococcoidia bacterium]|jgi:hypothetical protein|nr:hypothetical protein [Dehalococcoidia bacterium]
MLAVEILDAFKKLGISAYVEGDKLFCEPGSLLPPDLKPEIREHKAEIMALLSRTACTCPKPVGPAGCGPDYPVCSACRYTWYCKDCGGCRQCASPGRKVKTILPTQPHRSLIDDETGSPQTRRQPRLPGAFCHYFATA